MPVSSILARLASSCAFGASACSCCWQQLYHLPGDPHIWHQTNTQMHTSDMLDPIAETVCIVYSPGMLGQFQRIWSLSAPYRWQQLCHFQVSPKAGSNHIHRYMLLTCWNLVQHLSVACNPGIASAKSRGSAKGTLGCYGPAVIQGGCATIFSLGPRERVPAGISCLEVEVLLIILLGYFYGACFSIICTGAACNGTASSGPL